MSPYALPKDTIELLLIQQGLDGDTAYSTSIDKSLYAAVIEGLYKVKTLTRESDPGSENDYDVDKIDDQIKYYRRKYDIPEPEDYQFIDRTEEY